MYKLKIGHTGLKEAAELEKGCDISIRAETEIVICDICKKEIKGTITISGKSKYHGACGYA